MDREDCQAPDLRSHLLPMSNRHSVTEAGADKNGEWLVGSE